MVIAMAAVVLASAGSATAARLITGKQIRDGSVTSGDIRNRSLTGQDIKSRSVEASDLSASALRFGAASSAPVPAPAGPAGPAGPPGAPGAPGPTGIAQIVTVTDTGVAGGAVVLCPPTMKPVSGGGVDRTPNGAMWASAAFRDGDQFGWAVLSTDVGEVDVFAYCSAGVSSFAHRGPSTTSGGRAADGMLTPADLERMQAKIRR
jgi:hypothetical protein